MYPYKMYAYMYALRTSVLYSLPKATYLLRASFSSSMKLS